MEESNIPNNQENIQSINIKKIFVHLLKPEYIPVGTEFINIQDIDKADDNSFTEIIINDLLDYVVYNDTGNILDTLIKKLSTNGIITIQSVDLYQLSCAVAFEDIDLDTCKLVLYQNKRGIYTLYDIQSELLNRKLEIIEKRYINIFEYYIRAQKLA